MGSYTPISIVPTGLAPSYNSVALADTFASPQDQLTFLHVKNGSGSAVTVTIAPYLTSVPNGLAGTQTVSSLSVSVPASGDRMIGPFAPAFIDASGNVNVSYSSITSVTAAAIRMPRVA